MERPTNQPPIVHPDPDTVVSERYRIERLIGKGGMGAVYEATDLRLKGTVALKQTTLSGDVATKAFEREAQLLARLRHPALPKVIDYFADPAGQFLVMEYFPGSDLGQLLTERGSPFPVEQVLAWASQILDALAYLHQQQPPVIHRDIKPQNMKLTPAGDIVLLDFGLAKSKALQASHATTSGSVAGYTPMYAPLEQIQGEGTDPRSDLFSLAATLYHLMTGTPPIDVLTRAAAIVGRKPDPMPLASQRNAAVPVGVSMVLQQGLALDRDERPTSAVAMRDTLAQALQQPDAVRDMRTVQFDEATALGRGGAPASQPTAHQAARSAAAFLAAHPAAPTGGPVQQSAATIGKQTEPGSGTNPSVHPAVPPSETQAPTALSHPHWRPAGSAESPPDQPAQTGRHGFRFTYRSPLWPIVIIGFVILGTLRTLGLLPPPNFMLLGQLLPLWFLLAGLDQFIGWRSVRWGAVFGTVAAIAMLSTMLIGSFQSARIADENQPPATQSSEPAAAEAPALPAPDLPDLPAPEVPLPNDAADEAPAEELAPTGELQTAQVSEPLDGAQSAEVSLEVVAARVDIKSLPRNAPQLLQADLTYRGTLYQDTNGDARRLVRLGVEQPLQQLPADAGAQEPAPGSESDQTDEEGRPRPLERARELASTRRAGSEAPPGAPPDDTPMLLADEQWRIGLSRAVPIDLEIFGRTTETRLDLTDLQLASLSIDMPFGDVALELPATNAPYESTIQMGRSGLRLEIEKDATLSLLEITKESGSVDIEVDKDVAANLFLDLGATKQAAIRFDKQAAVRLEVNIEEEGSISMPERLKRISGAASENAGIWQTEGFEAAERAIIVEVELRSGQLVVK